MNFLFITEACSTEQPAGIDLSGSAQWMELETMQISQEDSFSEGIWSLKLPGADWPAVEQMSRQLLYTASKNLQLMAWWVRARLITEGLPGLQNGLQGLLCWIEHWWATGYPQLAQNTDSIKLGRLRWLDDQLGDEMKVLKRSSLSQENIAHTITAIIHRIEQHLQMRATQA
jgi:type VI secretion system protein ImpA